MTEHSHEDCVQCLQKYVHVLEIDLKREQEINASLKQQLINKTLIDAEPGHTTHSISCSCWQGKP